MQQFHLLYFQNVRFANEMTFFVDIYYVEKRQEHKSVTLIQVL